VNWVDIILIVAFINSALQGFSRGLILSAFKTCGVLVALYVGIFYRDMAVVYLKAYSPLEMLLSTMLIAPSAKAGTIEVMASKGILEMALGAVGFMLIFLGVQLIFLIPAYFINGLANLSGMTPVNRLLGLGFGLARTTLWIALLGAVLSPFLLVLPGSFLERSLNSSYILANIKFLDFITPIIIKLI